jgi:hypothetical protein
MFDNFQSKINCDKKGKCLWYFTCQCNSCVHNKILQIKYSYASTTEFDNKASCKKCENCKYSRKQDKPNIIACINPINDVYVNNSSVSTANMCFDKDFCCDEFCLITLNSINY